MGGESSKPTGSKEVGPDNVTVPSWVAANASSSNPTVWMDIAIGGETVGRVEIVLMKNVVPKTAENFQALCIGDKKDLAFKGSKFHRIIPNFMCVRKYFYCRLLFSF